MQFIKEMVEGAGFEPAKAKPADLQSAPFSHSGTPPRLLWSWREELNPQPADYKSAALPTELSGRNGYLILCGLKVCLSLFFFFNFSAQDLRSFAYGIRRIHLKIYLLKNMQACF